MRIAESWCRSDEKPSVVGRLSIFSNRRIFLQGGLPIGPGIIFLRAQLFSVIFEGTVLKKSYKNFLEGVFR